MGNFNGFLKAEFKPPKHWTLIERLSYTTDEILSKKELSFFPRVLLSNEKNVKDLIEKNTIIKNNKLTINVPSGFKTDLASISRILWWLIAPTDIARSAVIHDFLYHILRIYFSNSSKINKKQKRRLRKTCDKIFYYAMCDSDPKVPMWKIQTVYRAVRLFGWTKLKGY